MRTAFLSLILVKETKGQEIFDAEKEGCLEEYGLELKNYIGYAPDGVPTMVFD